MIVVMLCCNDERGDHAGRIERINFKDRRGFNATLEGPSIVCRRATAYATGRVDLRVSRRIFETAGYQPWVGNMCWDAVRMSKAEALRLLAYVIERGYRPTDWTTTGPFAKVLREARAA